VGIESVVGSAYDESGPNSWLWAANFAHQYTSLIVTVAAGVLLANYPDGVVERRWQRWVVRAMWCLLALPPLLLVTRPNLVISPYLLDPPPDAPVASPFAVEWLAPFGWPLEMLFLSYAGALLGLSLLLVRYLQADRQQRRQMRLLVYSMAAVVPVLLAVVAVAMLGVPADSFWYVLLGSLGETPEMLLAELQADAGELLADLRELAHGIHSPVLSDGGLVAAVEARAGRLPLDVTVRADEALRSRRLDADVEAAAYFVICEALTNVIKHARAERALVHMSAVNGELSLLVHDDGTGLSTTNGNGQGLTNLRDRVDAVGGRLRVDGRPGEGTSVSAELPVGAPDG
jgi:hypothetical protein